MTCINKKSGFRPDENQCSTILLVEDEAIISIFTAKSLKMFGYNVVFANSGERAVEIIASGEKINLILMDIYLGKGIDGTEAARLITGISNIPIMFCTSHSRDEMAEKIKDITHFGYVIKGSGDIVLQSSIETAFRLSETECRIDRSN